MRFSDALKILILGIVICFLPVRQAFAYFSLFNTAGTEPVISIQNSREGLFVILGETTVLLPMKVEQLSQLSQHEYQNLRYQLMFAASASPFLVNALSLIISGMLFYQSTVQLYQMFSDNWLSHTRKTVPLVFNHPIMRRRMLVRFINDDEGARWEILRIPAQNAPFSRMKSMGSMEQHFYRLWYSMGLQQVDRLELRWNSEENSWYSELDKDPMTRINWPGFETLTLEKALLDPSSINNEEIHQTLLHPQRLDLLTDALIMPDDISTDKIPDQLHILSGDFAHLMSWEKEPESQLVWLRDTSLFPWQDYSLLMIHNAPVADQLLTEMNHPAMAAWQSRLIPLVLPTHMVDWLLQKLSTLLLDTTLSQLQSLISLGTEKASFWLSTEKESQALVPAHHPEAMPDANWLRYTRQSPSDGNNGDPNNGGKDEQQGQDNTSKPDGQSVKPSDNREPSQKSNGEGGGAGNNPDDQGSSLPAKSGDSRALSRKRLSTQPQGGSPAKQAKLALEQTTIDEVTYTGTSHNLSIPQGAEQLLLDGLKRHQLYRLPVPMDGHCYYNSIALAMNIHVLTGQYSILETATTIRRKISANAVRVMNKVTETVFFKTFTSDDWHHDRPMMPMNRDNFLSSIQATEFAANTKIPKKYWGGDWATIITQLTFPVQIVRHYSGSQYRHSQEILAPYFLNAQEQFRRSFSDRPPKERFSIHLVNRSNDHFEPWLELEQYSQLIMMAIDEQHRSHHCGTACKVVSSIHTGKVMTSEELPDSSCVINAFFSLPREVIDSNFKQLSREQQQFLQRQKHVLDPALSEIGEEFLVTPPSAPPPAPFIRREDQSTLMDQVSDGAIIVDILSGELNLAQTRQEVQEQRIQQLQRQLMDQNPPPPSLERDQLVQSRSESEQFTERLISENSRLRSEIQDRDRLIRELSSLQVQSEQQRQQSEQQLKAAREYWRQANSRVAQLNSELESLKHDIAILHTLLATPAADHQQRSVAIQVTPLAGTDQTTPVIKQPLKPDYLRSPPEP